MNFFQLSASARLRAHRISAARNRAATPASSSAACSLRCDYSVAPLAPVATDPETASPRLQPSGDAVTVSKAKG
jgi:hypothetical protein